jgi:hypothetical protein
MSKLVESLKRLFVKGKVTEIKLTEMLNSGTITHEEYEFIVS